MSKNYEEEQKRKNLIIENLLKESGIEGLNKGMITHVRRSIEGYDSRCANTYYLQRRMNEDGIICYDAFTDERVRTYVKHLDIEKLKDIKLRRYHLYIGQRTIELVESMQRYLQQES